MAMLNIKTLRRLRAPLRSSVTRYEKESETLLQQVPCDVMKCTVLRDSLISIKTDLAEINDQILALVEEGDLEDEVEKREYYREKLNKVLFSLNYVLTSNVLQQNSIVGSHSSQATSVQEDSLAKLPFLKINNFKGDPLKWQEFWDSFEAMVHNRESLTPVVKFNYLLSFIEGEAKRALEGFAVTNANYEEAIKMLKERFGKEDVIIFAHLNRIFALPASSEETRNLRETYDECEKHIRCLSVFGQLTIDQIFVPLILSKLPEDVQLLLQRNNGSRKWELSSLRKMLKEEIEARETIKSSVSKYSKPVISKQPSQKSQTSALISQQSSSGAKSQPKKGTSNSRMTCVFCSEGHYSSRCSTYGDLEARKKKLVGRCLRCFKQDHEQSSCSSDHPCYYCNNTTHHSCLCPIKFGVKNAQNSQVLRVSTTSDEEISKCNQETLMETACIHISNPESTDKRSVLVRLILDGGSNKCYITENYAKLLKLKPKCYENLSVSVFGSRKRKNMSCGISDLELKHIDGSSSTISVGIVPVITCATETTVFNASKYPQLLGLKLADNSVVSSAAKLSVDLLIGNNYYYYYVSKNRIDLARGLTILDTKFGWIPAGRDIANEEKGETNSSHALLALSPTRENSDINSSLERFWNLESIGIKDSPIITDDEMALQKFKNTIQVKNGRYEVTWPWKDQQILLPDNYMLSYGRLKSIVNRLSEKSKEQLLQYDSIIKDQLERGVIEKIKNSDDNSYLEINKLVHYIPHHCVIRQEKATTKMRIVYDASAKATKGSCSLNDCLLRGPIIMEDLSAILLRFRENRIAITCDVEKAFLQVGLQTQDREVTRFLWLKDIEKPISKSNLATYRFCRIPFGVISSPFLLSATISHHLRQSQSSMTEKVLHNIYVDNILTGFETDEEALKLYTELKATMKEASMNIREWTSNSQNFRKCIPKEDCIEKREDVSVLGLSWNAETDKIHIRGPKYVEMKSPTKRYVLKTISEVFDPLGLCSPVIIKGKIMMQELWKLKLEWSDPLPSDSTENWEALYRDICILPTIELPRFINMQELSSSVTFELHCFCDASVHAYAAAVYLLVVTPSEKLANIIFSKTRVSPIKTVSIPRLELMAVVLGVRVLEYVQKSLTLIISRVILWSDSKCVLYWIHNRNKPMKTFVENRLREVRSKDVDQFRYVSTGENPADLPSRGITSSELHLSKIWWYGPVWLSSEEENWPPIWHERMANYENEEIECMQLVVSAKEVLGIQVIIQIQGFSVLKRLLHVTAYAIRFVEHAKTNLHAEKLELSALEIKNALFIWIKDVQLQHFREEIQAIGNKKKNTLVYQLGLFIDERKILRCKGRIELAELSYETKFPMLLPKNDHLTMLIVLDIHQRSYHVGVRQTLSSLRQRFWIPHGRSVVCKALNMCQICRKCEGKSYATPHAPPLPKARIQQNFPFTYTGTDHLGPLLLKKNEKGIQQKIWICLFTCASVRAIHLEVTSDLSAREFLLALRRFVSRRGIPKQIFSDNAKNFKLASKALTCQENIAGDPSIQDYASSNGIEWKFIVEYAPWMGGFYERLVSLVKRSLRKAVGRSCLTLVQLQTIVTEIEAVINSRPLTYMETEFSDSKILTPSHFLFGNPNTVFNDVETTNDPSYLIGQDSAEMLLLQWKKGQKLLNQFWNVWRNDYLLSLRERSTKNKQHATAKTPPEVGHVVLVGDKLPRGRWKMGRISELIMSADEECRSAVVTLPNNKKIQRSIKMLFPIETSPSMNQACPSTEDRIISTRNFRLAAVRAKEKIHNIFHN